MYWPLLNMYSENFGFGPGGFIIRGTFINRGKGLATYGHNYNFVCATVFTQTHVCMCVCIHIYIYTGTQTCVRVDVYIYIYVCISIDPGIHIGAPPASGVGHDRRVDIVQGQGGRRSKAGRAGRATCR